MAFLTVYQTSPTANEVNVSGNIQPNWRFYESGNNSYFITISGIKYDSVALYKGSTRIAGTVSGLPTQFSSITSGVIFKPTSPLEGNTVYTMYAYAAPSGVYNAWYNYLESPYSSSFTTAFSGIIPTPPKPAASGAYITNGQIIYDNGIISDTTNSRGIGPQGSVASNSQYIIEPDGKLVAIVPDGRDRYLLRSSTDNGYTWTTQDNNVDWTVYDMTFNQSDRRGYGARIALNKFKNFISEKVKYTNNYTMVWGGSDAIHNIGSYEEASSVTPWGQYSNKFYGTFDIPVISGFFASDSDNDDMFYSAYTTSSSYLAVVGQNFNARSKQSMIQDYKSTNPDTYVNNSIAVRSRGALLHIIAVKQNDILSYLQFTKVTGTIDAVGTSGIVGSFGTSIPIKTGSKTGHLTSFVEPTVAVDGLGNICTYYTYSTNNIVGSGEYALSNNNGLNWNIIQNSAPTGYSGYIDSMTNTLSPSNDILGLASGFLIASVFQKDGIGSVFVKEIPAYNISGVSTIDWRKVNSVNDNVLAAKFFRFTNNVTPNNENKGSIRMAYQVGYHNNIEGLGTIPTTIYQERITNNAFPVVNNLSTYTKDNIDFYASGYISDTTRLYNDKIDELGMSYVFKKYNPLPDSSLNGISGYDLGEEFEHVATIDPGSYGFPTVARSDEDFEQYIARDTRKIFYKADAFLERKFVLNRAGKLKRTIWTVKIMGNEYELAQIVPRWLDGSIMYYEANLYVIGPSNDPFSKIILPNET